MLQELAVAQIVEWSLPNTRSVCTSNLAINIFGKTLNRTGKTTIMLNAPLFENILNHRNISTY